MNAPIEYLVYKINILKKAVFVIAIVLILGIFFAGSFSFGFLVGSLISLGNFSLLARHVLEMKEFSLRKAKLFIISRFLLMYVIMGFTLFVASTKGMFTLIGVACGLLVIQIVIFIDSMMEKHVRARTN